MLPVSCILEVWNHSPKYLGGVSIENAGVPGNNITRSIIDYITEFVIRNSHFVIRNS